MEKFARQELNLRHWSRGGARPVLALHCALAHGGSLGLVAEALQGVTVTAPDLPGHGESAVLPAGADFHDLSTALAKDLLEQLGQDGNVDLIGHSFGATVALRLALEHPALVRSLTLIEPPLFAAAAGSAAFAASAAHNLAVDALLPDDPMAAASLFHAEWGGGLPFKVLPQRQRDYMAARMPLVVQSGAVLAEDWLGLLAKGRLEALQLPLLLVQGDKSPAVVAPIMETLARRLPQAVRLILPAASHMLPITHPAALATAVQALLARS